MDIRIDDLRGPEIARLLQEHLDEMFLHSPPESVHALDLERLRRPEITFWTVWKDGALLGCGALKALDAAHGEIKSMRTAAGHQRKGVAAAPAFVVDPSPRAPFREPAVTMRGDRGSRWGTAAQSDVGKEAASAFPVPRQAKSLRLYRIPAFALHRAFAPCADDLTIRSS